MEPLVTLSSGVTIRQNVYERLYKHQVAGVEFLYKHFLNSEGCILADDMGLGKTVQVIVLLSSLYHSLRIKTVLIVVPSTLLLNWENEINTWSPEIEVFKFDKSSSSSCRMRLLINVQENMGVLLTTYDLCRRFGKQFSHCRETPFVWDYLILDEGHKIKNPTNTNLSINAISSRRRLILTGTPLQNSLCELWALFDFVMKGTLLGTYESFKISFENPIIRGRQRNACNKDIICSNRTADMLREIYTPYMLRRTKSDILRTTGKWPTKTDLVVWINLSGEQTEIYKKCLNSNNVQQPLLQDNMKNALVSLSTLKKICDHPFLIDQDTSEIMSFSVNTTKLSRASAKVSFSLCLLQELRAQRHKTLLFSQSTKILDIFENILLKKQWLLLRLDGDVRSMKKRNDIITKFQVNPDIHLCLISSQVGNVGLTITSATRVIIYDPSWNPATDNQAVDRVYRIGQQRNVIIYRLITCGTVEEKIYQRQIYKKSLTELTLERSSNPTRYFTEHELRNVLKIANFQASDTFDMISKLHIDSVNFNDEVASHVKFLRKAPHVFNVHNHKVLFSNAEAEVKEKETYLASIEREVHTACEKLEKESALTKNALNQSTLFTRPFYQEISYYVTRKGKKLRFN